MVSSAKIGKLPQGAVAWALYDWANTGYALVVLAAFYPIFYRSYWAADMSPGDQTFWFGLTVSGASALVFILAPVLGNIAEVGRCRKRLLLRFAATGMVACASLAIVGHGKWWLASAIYVVGTVGFYCANIFFDSLLGSVSTLRNRHFISGFGFMFGYSAGVILLVGSFALLNFGSHVGLADPTTVVKTLFVIAALWWALFTIPLILKIPEDRNREHHSVRQLAWQGLVNTKTTLLLIISNRPVLWFLIAYAFYIDGVNTIITMSINYAKTLGFANEDLLVALLIVQITGVPCAILFGWLGQRYGPRRFIFVAIGIYIGVSAYGARLDPTPISVAGFAIPGIYILAALIGSVQGGIQALSRSFFCNLIPPEHTVAFFGFYSMIGKSAAILGPLLMGLVALLTNDPRYGIAAVSVLFVIGGMVLMKVRPHGHGHGHGHTDEHRRSQTNTDHGQ